jgi:L-ascorbate metabolism protein UlaG (beta-lactamase superfamily)
MSRSWRTITDLVKHKRAMMKLADHLGRGRGRLRMLDEVITPLASRLKPDLDRWESRTLAATWVGHATTLLRIGQKTVLTDPVFSSRVGIGFGLLTAGPKRFIAPALRVGELPPIDLILISHAHFDHLDRPSLMRLNRKTPVITAPDTADLVADLGFKSVTELRWGESRKLDDLTITATPVRHWGARTFYDQYRGYNAYILQSSDARVLYGGDSAYHEEFARLDPVDLAILGIGAYDPWVAAHATPEQAWAMAGHVNAKFVFPMHHSTFKLSHEPMHEPIARIIRAANGSAGKIIIREPGELWSQP